MPCTGAIQPQEEILHTLIEALFESQWDTLVERLTFQTGSAVDAEDLAARAFERLLEQLERGTDVGDLHARLNLIAQGLLFNHYRDQERRQRVEAPWDNLLAAERQDSSNGTRKSALAGGSDADGTGYRGNISLAQPHPTTFEDAEFAVSFDTAIRALDPEPRDALILTDLRGLTVREAARVLNTSKDTVARARLAAHTFVTKEIPR